MKLRKRGTVVNIARGRQVGDRPKKGPGSLNPALRVSAEAIIVGVKVE